MAGERELVEENSQNLLGIYSVRERCALGEVLELEKIHKGRISSAAYCRESLEFALKYAVNGSQSVSPNARREDNNPLYLYMGLGAQLTGIRSMEVAMDLVNEIVAKSANNGSKAPVQISRRHNATGQTRMMEFSLAGVLDAAAVKELMEVQNGRAPRRQPIPEEIMNSGFAKCTYVNTSRESEFDASRTQRGGCVQGGEFLVANILANTKRGTSLRP